MRLPVFVLVWAASSMQIISLAMLLRGALA